MTISLNQLSFGTEAMIHELQVSGSIRERLMDLGLVPGTPIQAVLSSPIGDPVCYKVRGALIALRKHDAGQIMVNI